jgi:glutathione synthase/RimK-type ligase-like ATP-grasp enzyme
MLVKILQENNHLMLDLNQNYFDNTSQIFWGIHRCDVIYNSYLKHAKFNNTFYKIKNLEHINIFYDESDCMRIGPFLGILISAAKKEHVLEGYQDNVYIKLTNHMRNLGGLLVFFTIDDIDWNELLIKGHLIGTDNLYHEVCVPFPRVIYDRCFGSKGRLVGADFREKINEFGLTDIKIYNCMVKLGKLETYELCSKNKDLQKITLPYSEFSFQSLTGFMEKYDSVYIKPDLLYKGEGIIKVSRNGQYFSLEHHRDKLFTRKSTNDLMSVIDLMEDFGHLSQRYVIQKSISLASFLGNPFDVRVMLQKNGLGEWEVSGVLARVGPENCLITSPRSGGQVIRLSEALSSAFPGQIGRRREIKQNIENYAIKIGLAMEAEYGLIGELGIDMGVDSDGSVWMIEVNGKPLKVSMKRLNSKPVDIKINRYPCLFGAFLDGFPCKSTESHSAAGTMELIELTTLPPKTITINKSEVFQTIDPGKPVLIKLGSSEITAGVHISNSLVNHKQIGISSDIMTAMGCCSGIKINMFACSNNVICLGPLLAVLKSPIEYKYIKNTKYKEIEYIEKVAYELGCMLFYFTAQDINWSDEKMVGIFFNRITGKWEDKYFPLPDIVYDLGSFPEKVVRETAKEMMRLLRKRENTALINSRRFFGKYQTIQSIKFLNQTKDLIPATRHLTIDNLQELLLNWKRVFVKSEYGSHGHEVTYIEETDGIFKCETGGRRNKYTTFKEFKELFQFIETKYGETMAVVQQAIKLSTYKGKTFDLRIVMQKDDKANWQINLVSLRLAPYGSLITNISSGGTEFVPPLHELEHHIPGMSMQYLVDFARKIALAIECSFGRQGILGLDVAIDTKGRLWLLEVNSKPSIMDYIDLCSESQAYKFYATPIKYSLYLVQQTAGLICSRLEHKLAGEIAVSQILQSED